MTLVDRPIGHASGTTFARARRRPGVHRSVRMNVHIADYDSAPPGLARLLAILELRDLVQEVGGDHVGAGFLPAVQSG